MNVPSTSQGHFRTKEEDEERGREEEEKFSGQYVGDLNVPSTAQAHSEHRFPAPSSGGRMSSASAWSLPHRITSGRKRKTKEEEEEEEKKKRNLVVSILGV